VEECRQDTRCVSHAVVHDGRREVWLQLETDGAAVQCPNEKCRNDEAYWYQLQIRSADEPMTAFYKVSCL